MSVGATLVFGTSYDEGERLLALVPMIRGLVRCEATDVSDATLMHDMVFEMWFSSEDHADRFRRAISRRLPGGDPSYVPNVRS